MKNRLGLSSFISNKKEMEEYYEKSLDSDKLDLLDHYFLSLVELGEYFESELLKSKKIRTCKNCRFYDDSHACNNENSIAYHSHNRVYSDDFCSDHETKEENNSKLKELFEVVKQIKESK